MDGKKLLRIFISFVLSAAAIILFGRLRWRSRTNQLRARMETARRPVIPQTYNSREIESLPAPVQRYFRAVLKDGQRMIAAAHFSHEGEFRMKESEDRWTPFTSDQVATTRPPAFDWDARMRMAPGVTAFVHDAYVQGEGILHAEALGLVTVADLRGTPAAAQGELMRYFAEAVWYPTALLPSQGVRWEAVDDSTAKATLTDGATTVRLEFHFDPQGLVSSVSAEGRYHQDIGGVPAFAPWHCRLWAYEDRDGMQIPLEGEVAWVLPDELLPYWRGRITKIDFEYA